MGENNMLEKDFKKIINNIKHEIQKTQYKVAIESNINLISMYFRLGKILNDNYKYGNKFIDEVSKNLKMEFPNSAGFSVRNLKYMKKFYLEYKDDEEVQQLVAQVPWGHNIVLMEKVKDKKVRKVYIDGILKNGWGRNVLSIQIDSEYHLRIGASNNNFENTLPTLESDLVNYTIKDPYIFDFLSIQNESTIGLLLCKDKDRLTVDYTLKSINVPIGVSSFEIEKYIPKDILEKLPTEEDFNLHIDINEEDNI